MNALTPNVSREDASEALARTILEGDLSRLTAEQKVTHYNATCQSLGINPLTRPLEYIRLNGKEVLYARKDCTDQLRSLRKVSVQIVDRAISDGLCIVTARATLPDGRTDEEIGAVPLGNAQGEARANAIMKAMTKAKRRVTLSICGLGFLDESEIDGAMAGQSQAPREVPNLAPATAPKPAVVDEAEFPIIAPDGRVFGVRRAKWMPSVERALSQLGSLGAVSGWRAEMGPLLASMHDAGEADLVAEAEAAIEARKTELAISAEGVE